VVGGKLKSIGNTYWGSPNTGATDEVNFTALPSGFRYFEGSFINLGYYSNWWSSTSHNLANAWERNISNINSNIYNFHDYKEVGASIRCLKD
jgi:uncharacterized protein (TIGR02145 family)